MRWFLTTEPVKNLSFPKPSEDDADLGIGPDYTFDESELHDKIRDLEFDLREEYRSRGPVGTEVKFDPKKNNVELSKISTNWGATGLTIRFNTVKHYETGKCGGYIECFAYPVMESKALELTHDFGLDE